MAETFMCLGAMYVSDENDVSDVAFIGTLFIFLFIYSFICLFIH